MGVRYHVLVYAINSKLYTPKTSPKKFAPKNVCVVKFGNKSLDPINFLKIFHLPDRVSSLPLDPQSEEDIPFVTYGLRGTIRNNVIYYKDIVYSICVDYEVSFTRNKTQCECESSNVP